MFKYCLSLLVCFVFGSTILLSSCHKDNNDPVPEEQLQGNDTTLNGGLNDTLDEGDNDTIPFEPADTIQDEPVYNREMYLYAALNNDNQIAVYKIDTATGELSIIEKVAAKGRVGSLALSQSHKYLYAAIRSTNQVSSYAIDTTSGKLRIIGTADVADNPVYIIPDKTNSYLLTTYYNAGKLAIYPIIGDSIIDDHATVDISAGTNPHCVQTSPDNSFLYIPALGSDCTWQYQFDESNGTINAINPDHVQAAAGAGPRHLTFHPSLSVVYVINELNSTINMYNMNTENGTLSGDHVVTTLPTDYSGSNSCADIHITSNGAYLYASNRGHNTIAAFSVNAEDGTLTGLGQFDTEPVPREFDIDPTGNYLYAGGESSGKIAAYKILSDGTLDKINTYSAGTSITWILVVDYSIEEELGLAVGF